MNGVPDLTRSSGKHTEYHHLIRCLAPEKVKEAASSTEQRFMSLEKRLDKMQTRFENLDNRIGNIEQLLHRLAGKIE
jgi:prefoldin subunit 5